MSTADRLARRPQTQLQTKSSESSEAELALHAEVRAARSELDESKRKASRLSQESRELSSQLEASERDRETLKEAVSQLEEAGRQQEKALEKLHKEVFENSQEQLLLRGAKAPELKPSPDLLLFSSVFVPPALCCQHESLSASSREDLQALRVQMEEQREKARKDIQEAQRHGNHAQSELDQHHANLRRLEEEVGVMKMSAGGKKKRSLTFPGFSSDIPSEERADGHVRGERQPPAGQGAAHQQAAPPRGRDRGQQKQLQREDPGDPHPGGECLIDIQSNKRIPGLEVIPAPELLELPESFHSVQTPGTFAHIRSSGRTS